MRREVASQPQQVTLGAHERCHGCHRVRVESKIPKSHLRPIIVDTGYLQYRVCHSGWPYLVFHWTTYCLDRNPFRYTLLPCLDHLLFAATHLVIGGVVRARHRTWTQSSILGPNKTKISSPDMRAKQLKPTSGPKCSYATRRIRWNGPFLLMPQVHFATIMTSNRCYTTNLVAARNLGTTDVGTPRPRKRLCLGERKYLVVHTNQRGSLLGFLNFAGCCHAIGQVSPIPFDLVLLGPALASTGLALDARKV